MLHAAPLCAWESFNIPKRPQQPIIQLPEHAGHLEGSLGQSAGVCERDRRQIRDRRAYRKLEEVLGKSRKALKRAGTWRDGEGESGGGWGLNWVLKYRRRSDAG
jgi:hypothetical protein